MNPTEGKISSEADIIKMTEEQVRGKSLEEVDEIQISDIENANFGKMFREKIASFPKLVCLGINNVQFRSIQELPALRSLLRLELCYCSFDLRTLQQIHILFPKLFSLRLVGCNITSLEQIRCLQNLTQLAQLDIFDNPIYKFDAEYLKLHDQVFKMFKNLVYLDNLKKDYSRACTIPDKEAKAEQLKWEIDIPISHFLNPNPKEEIYTGRKKVKRSVNSDEEDFEVNEGKFAGNSLQGTNNPHLKSKHNNDDENYEPKRVSRHKYSDMQNDNNEDDAYMEEEEEYTGRMKQSSGLMNTRKKQQIKGKQY